MDRFLHGSQTDIGIDSETRDDDAINKAESNKGNASQDRVL
jgi:hypothetical protein